jgi:plastocyanin domain-containing protein
MMETVLVNLVGLALIGFIVWWFWVFKSGKG